MKISTIESTKHEGVPPHLQVIQNAIDSYLKKTGKGLFTLASEAKVSGSVLRDLMGGKKRQDIGVATLYILCYQLSAVGISLKVEDVVSAINIDEEIASRKMKQKNKAAG
jgi:hypothetical protein